MSSVERRETVVVLGAGASAACGTPVTNEILWRALCDGDVLQKLEAVEARREDVEHVRACLTEQFHVPENGARSFEFPSLTLLLSILDLSIDRNRPLAASRTHPSGLSREELAKARNGIEYMIFGVLDYFLGKADRSHVQRALLSHPEIVGTDGPQVISLNYEIIADTVMCGLAQRNAGERSRLDYVCDVSTQTYRDRDPYGTLLKLHGSLNWLYCPGCQALQVGMSANGKDIADSSVLKALYEYRALDEHYICSKHSCRACQCEYCETPLRPVMITPSFVKDYRNPHIQRVWYEAERLLRQCRRAYIVGYSLPDDDLEVIHLLRRGLQGCDPSRITVVTKDPDAAMYRRYVSLFGPGIDWQHGGFEKWMAEAGPSPLLGLPPDRAAAAPR
jgi:NAD-dependent SIR2 family protein deacetylase